jgi:microcystin-dependent protein
MSTNCSNCFNGCAQIVSDKCVRYTGLPSEALGIQTGDTLLSVEEVLINNVVSFLNGTGIDITINFSAYCNLVTKYLPSCKPSCQPPTAVELFEALVKAACDLQGQVDAVAADIATIEANYSIGCLTGVTSSSGTHAIVQAVITKLCQLGVDLTALAVDVDTNYVKLADLNSLIAAYLGGIGAGTKQYLRMVPYTVVEYYGPLANYPTTSDGFNGSGVGFGAWEKVYLCNGLNGTPDKRGRVAVGVTNGVGGGAFDSAVDPTIPGNPTYSIGTKAGANVITLTSAQIPSHTHPATGTASDTGHTHLTVGSTDSGNIIDATHPIAKEVTGDPVEYSYTLNSAASTTATLGKTSSNTSLGLTIGVTVNNNTGGDGSHANNQPALACYYIMYIP